eukprot:1695117-Pleurochrysis_carterae.AAC.2
MHLHVAGLSSIEDDACTQLCKQSLLQVHAPSRSWPPFCSCVVLQLASWRSLTRSAPCCVFALRWEGGAGPFSSPIQLVLFTTDGSYNAIDRMHTTLTARSHTLVSLAPFLARSVPSRCFHEKAFHHFSFVSQ